VAEGLTFQSTSSLQQSPLPKPFSYNSLTQDDVAVTPDVPPVKARQAWRQVELELPQGSKFVFDGKKIAISTTEIGQVTTFEDLIKKNEMMALPPIIPN
jgi:hypothetical protein